MLEEISSDCDNFGYLTQMNREINSISFNNKYFHGAINSGEGDSPPTLSKILKVVPSFRGCPAVLVAEKRFIEKAYKIMRKWTESGALLLRTDL